MNVRTSVPPRPPISRARPAETLLPYASLSDIGEILWRRRFSLILIPLLSVVLTIGYVQLIRGDLYMAEAKLLVRIGQEQAPSPTMIDRSMMIGTPVGYAAPEVEMFRSRDAIGKLVDQVDLTPKPPEKPTSLIGLVKYHAKRIWTDVKDGFDEALIWAGLKTRLTPREAAIEAIAKALVLESPPNSNIFTARIFWPQRGVPEVLLHKLIDIYLAKRAELFQGSTATQFFKERVAATRSRLDHAEEALAQFERANGITNPDEQRAALQRRLTEADTGVDASRLDLQLAETALSQLRAAQAKGENDLAVFAVAQYGSALQQTLAGEMATAASRLLAAQTALSNQDLNIRRLQASMVALSRALEQQLTATADQRRRQLALREQQRDAIRSELQTLQDASIRWQELKRDVGSALRAYEFNDRKLNEATGIAALEAARIGNIVVMQDAAEQATPVGVRKFSLLMLAVAGGLMLSLSWIVLREFFDHRLKKPDDVSRHLGLRVLASVAVDRRGIQAGRPPAPEVDAEMAHAAASLARLVTEEGMRVLVMTAGTTGEGTSTVCTHVGRHLAHLLGLRILMIDLGGARPGLASYAARLPAPPVPVPLSGRDALSALRRDRPSAFAVIDLSPQAAGSASVSLDEVITAAEGAFDLILVDAPPWTNGSETLLAIRASRHVMLVASANVLAWETLEQICTDLEAERVELVGCVFNRYERQLPRFLRNILR